VLQTKRSGNIASGVFLAVLGLAAAWTSLDIDEGAGGNLHPRTFPLMVGVCLLLGGLTLAAVTHFSKAGGHRTIDWPDRRGRKLWAIAFVSLVAYVGLSGPFGFPLCTFFFVAGFIWYFGRYNPLVAVAWAAGMVLFVYFVFIKLLEMTMPMGPFSFLA
jgi:putative tricarboxylic transport membrane protein